MKRNKGKKDLFDRIAGYYGWFFEYQRKKYNKLIDSIDEWLPLYHYSEMVDIGCGTGAFCAELYCRGFHVTGVDSSAEMLAVAGEKLDTALIDLVQGDIAQGVPFEDKRFDVAFTSFVAHGLTLEKRRLLYSELKRITKHRVIIYDYNEKRSLLTDLIEWLEGGDYFNFIKNVRVELEEAFGAVEEIRTGGKASCYVMRLDG